MTPQFLREEAARFRGMAETVDREASKLRLLKMASDYEAKASAAGAPEQADETTEPTPLEATPLEPAITETIKIKLPRKTARELKETA